MDIRNMRYVLTTMKAGSFTKAARQMYLSPQALGKAIRTIEEEYGTPLFERDARALTPTPFGYAFAREAEKCVADFDSACVRIEGFAQQAVGHIVVACAYSMPNALGYKGSAELQTRLKARTGLDMEITLDELPDLLAERVLDDEGCEIALLNGAPVHEEAYDLLLLRQERVTAVVRLDHPLAGKKTVRVEDVAQYPVATFNRYYRLYHLLEQEAQARQLKIRYAAISPDGTVWVEKVNEGDVGICVNFLDREVKDCGWVNIPFEEEEMTVSIYLARHKRAASNKYLQALWKTIAEDAKEESPCPLP